MRIGYPVRNLALEQTRNMGLQVISLDVDMQHQATRFNLDLLLDILRFNLENGLMLYRISNELIPNAVHPRNRFHWERDFLDVLAALGSFALTHGMRLTIHPDIYTVIHSPNPRVRDNSLRDLRYQCRLLETMGLGPDHKVQIHLGDLCEDIATSLRLFVAAIKGLEPDIRARLVIENDNQLFTARDCLSVYEETGLPVVLDVLHHQIRGNGEALVEVLTLAARTWQDQREPPMVEYSTQRPGKMPGKHDESIDTNHFREFLSLLPPGPWDLMTEFKDRERSALEALKIFKQFCPAA